MPSAQIMPAVYLKIKYLESWLTCYSKIFITMNDLNAMHSMRIGYWKAEFPNRAFKKHFGMHASTKELSSSFF